MIRRCLPSFRGKYSSMMDLGGVASAKTKTKLDFSKNNKIRAVALDFDLLTRSIDEIRQKRLQEEQDQLESNSTLSKEEASKKSEIDKKSDGLSGNKIVRDLASLLNFNMKTFTKESEETKVDDGENDDLSLLQSKSNTYEKPSIMKPHRPKDLTDRTIKAPPQTADIRSKYASKIRQKLNSSPDGGPTGSAASIDLMKEEINSSKGDADSHFHARQIAMTQHTNTSPSRGSKWLASTGAGSLLTFLMTRSMKIILLPIPKLNMLASNPNAITNNYDEEQGQRMIDLTKQLPNIRFDHLISKGETAESIVNKIMEDLKNPSKQFADNENDNADIDPNYFGDDSSEVLPKHCLVVTDRDDYLKMAKDEGMFTCRIRKENARRGNITAAYNCLEIANVEEIVNEINGISFNSVFGSR